MKKLLSTSAHNSFETAYEIANWPYGRTLRCTKKVWVETNKKGQRIVTQTSNPKRGNDWGNAPKAGVYSTLCIFGEDENGLLVFDGLSFHSSPEKFAEMRALPLDAGQVARVDSLEKISRAVSPKAWAEYDAKK